MANAGGGQTGETALKGALRAAAKAFVALGAVSGALNILHLVTPLYMLSVYDRVLASGSRETLFYLTLIALVALAVFGVLEGARTAILARTGAWLSDRLGGPTLRASLKAALAKGGGGAEPLRDLQQVQNFLGGPSVNPFFDAPWAPVFVIFIWLLHPWLGVLALITAVLLFAIALGNEVLTRKPLREGAGALNMATREADGIVAHAETVHAMGMESQLEARWRTHQRAAQAAQTSGAELGGWITGASRFVRLSAQVGVLGLGALLVLRGELSAGSMIAGSILLGRALAPVEQSIGAWRAFVAARFSYQRLGKLMEAFPETPSRMALPEPRGMLSVEQLYVRAPNSDVMILSSVSFALKPGEAIAVVGPSAAGKSTLCRAVCGTVPVFRGAVRLDGAEIDHWPREQFGAAVGYLPQTVELFDGSIRENIARMGEADDEAVTRAAMLAGVHELILKLPDGYETRVGPTGVALSGGQRQRIGLARAIFGDPKLIVLDEPNSNLDQDGEAALTGTIARLKRQGAGVLLVAHRQSALAAVDKILVMKDGAVEMFDARDEVLRIMAERRRFASQQAKADGAQPKPKREVK
ncbi:MAG: type I secretion system permease/ATPase [Oceanicaulis sp.]